MKTHRKTLLLMLLIFCMVLTTMPALALAAGEADADAQAEAVSGSEDAAEQSTEEAMEEVPAEEPAEEGPGDTGTDAPEETENTEMKGKTQKTEKAEKAENLKKDDSDNAERREYTEEELDDFSQILDIEEYEGEERDSWDYEGDDAEEIDEEESDDEAESGEEPSMKLMAKNGTVVKFTGDKWTPFNAKRHVRRFTSSFKSAITGKKETFKGTCCYVGITALESGKIKLTRIKNTTAAAKMVWYYGYELGWWNTKKGNASAKKELGLKSCSTNKRELISAICQVSNQGRESYISRCQSGCGMTKSFATRMANFVKKAKTDTANVKVPDNFEMYKGSPRLSDGTTDKKHQPMYIWYVKPDTSAYMSLTKVSAADKDFTGEVGDPESSGEGEGQEVASEAGSDDGGDDETEPGEGDWGDDLDDEIFDDVSTDDDPAYEAAYENPVYSLEGAKYQVYTADGKKVSGAVLTTDENGDAGPLKIDAGSYKVKEITPSMGFKLDPTEYTVNVTKKNTKDSPAEVGVKKNGDVVTPETPLGALPDLTIYKIPDPEPDYSKLTKDPVPLAGAEFVVKYYRVKNKADIGNAKAEAAWKYVTTEMPYYVKNAAGKYPAVAGFNLKNDRPVATTRGTLDDPFYHIKADKSDAGIIPLGWVTITETKAPDGYLKSEKTSYVNIAAVNGQVSVTCTDENGNNCAAAGTGYRMKVKNVPDHIFIRKTDSVTKNPVRGAKLQIIQNGRVVVPAWTTDGSDKKIEGLAAGEYILREIESPYGYDKAPDKAFTIGGALPQGEDHITVTMENTPITLSTEAVSASTNKHIGAAKAGERITDKVHMTGLVKGRKYRLTGQLMNKRTGQAVPDVTAAPKEFTADASVMDVTMDLSFDASKLTEGDSAVVFETLHRISSVNGDTVPAELAKHWDISDEAQTVIYPSILTTASLQKDNREVKDLITYKGLLPDMKYVFRGWLVDTATGSKVPDSDGRIELNTGANTSGEVSMVLKTEKYDEMSGHSMTAFEELYLSETDVDGTVKEILIAEHKDKNDRKQTVEIYHDLKVKKNVTGNLGDLTKVFEYTAEFTGLVPGSAYRIEGDDEKTFMADSSGRASVPLRLKDSQEAVIKDLPKSAEYTVTEAASDHVSEYRIFSEDMENKGAKITVKEASNGDEASKLLSTAKETVDLFDGTMVVLWQNNRDLAALTGVQTYIGIWAAGLALVLAGITFVIASRRINKGGCYEE